MTGRRRVEARPATPDTWDDLAELFGRRGAYGGCWCMFFRLPGKAFDEGARGGGGGNRRRLRTIVKEGRTPGLIAYLDGRPVGWIAVAPKEEYRRLDRSPIGKAARPVPGTWSVVCFFVARDQRERGVAEVLLRAAVDHARRQGARAVEGYPLDLGPGRTDAASAYVGVRSMFQDAGFHEVGRASPTRPLMRRHLRRA